MDTVSKRTRQPNFILSPHQQSLLFAALNSNKGPTVDTSLQQPSIDSAAAAPMSFTESPLQAPGSGTLGGFEDSPFIDYDYDFDADPGFDYDFSNDSQGLMIGKLPGSSSDGDADTHDKRSHPDDEDNDEDGGGKRREGDDRSGKKPGRKPLTSEPTSKRKAQNRAAQRAFRERKEKHLKDLETKVQDLEKASETANHENSILRAQVEKMSVELREYRKRLSASGSSRSPPLSGGLPRYLTERSANSNTVNNPNDVNFQFEFPKFGRLPGPPVLNATRVANSNSTNPTPPTSVHRASSASNNGSISPFDQSMHHNPSFASTFSGINNSNAQDNQLFGGLDSNDLSEFFTPSAFESIGNELSPDQPVHNPSRSSTDSSHAPQSTGQSTSYSSPSASSNNGSNAGLSSSCGTSPEPYTQSPAGLRNTDNVLTTIGEERVGTNSIEGEASFCEKLAMACGSPKNPIPRTLSESGVQSGNFLSSGFDLKTPGFDLNGIDWFAQQNGNQFDPQLFGDYREPQNNILTGGLYDDTFFAEAFSLPEFNTASPYNFSASPAASKKDLVQEIDQKLNQEDEIVPGEDRTQLLTCNTMWEKIQSCPSVQNGNIDMDDLCSQLQSKAKCSGEGPVINERDFKEIIHKIVKKDGRPLSEDCDKAKATSISA